MRLAAKDEWRQGQSQREQCHGGEHEDQQAEREAVSCGDQRGGWSMGRTGPAALSVPAAKHLEHGDTDERSAASRVPP